MAETFVLVHGAWHGAWCWQRLIPLLEARGHRVLAPDLPGHGADPAPLQRSTLKRAAAQLQDLLENLDGGVTLVAHSMAGLPAAQAAEAVPERLRALVFLAAFLPRDGDSVFSLMALQRQRHGPTPIESAFRLSPDQRRCELGAGQAGELFFHDCEAGIAAEAEARLQQEASLLLSGKVALSEANFGSVPRVYIACDGDRVVPPAQQRLMLERQACERVLTLQSGHSPFLSQPKALCDLLCAL